MKIMIVARRDVFCTFGYFLQVWAEVDILHSQSLLVAVSQQKWQEIEEFPFGIT